MPKTTYAGIDYSLGKSNFDPNTRIHFGVIARNGDAAEALGDVLEAEYAAPECPECSGEVTDEFPENYVGSRDYYCETCEKGFYSDACTGDEPIGWNYEGDGYEMTDCLDTDVMVLKSPYYTRAQFCSPCVPGAGSLDSPCDDGPKTYCLGHDFFENEKAPYRVFRVEDDVEIAAVEREIECRNCKGSGRDNLSRIASVRKISIAELRQDEDLMQRYIFAEDGSFVCYLCEGKGVLVEVVEEEVSK